MAVPAPNAPTPTLPAPLTAVQFQDLAAIPPELKWFTNLTHPHIRRAYQQDIRDFQAFAGLCRPEAFRRKLAALSSLYAYLCDRHAVLHNPVLGVKRPRSMNRDGVTPALGDHQARMLLESPRALSAGARPGVTVDHRLLGGLRPYRRVPRAPVPAGQEQPHPASVYRNIVQHYASALGLTDGGPGLCIHSLRAIAATNALQHEADIAKVQEWLGHADISTTRMYDKRQSRP